MQTIVCITRRDMWDKSLKAGQYTQSTITSTLEQVGYIHASNPNQTLDIAQRFINEKEVVLLLIDLEKVKAPVKFEATRSGRSGLFPHIYGPLNIDAIYKIINLEKNDKDVFIAPEALLNAES